MKKIDVVILAGGYGTRIKKFTKNKIPKQLLKIRKRPFLDYLLQNISKYSINKILGINKFNLLTNNWKSEICALGGISANNVNKLRMTKVKSFSGISFFKKKAPH
jgi:UTP-glucose-1-phosphate uridylyltransferase